MRITAGTIAPRLGDLAATHDQREASHGERCNAHADAAGSTGVAIGSVCRVGSQQGRQGVGGGMHAAGGGMHAEGPAHLQPALSSLQHQRPSRPGSFIISSRSCRSGGGVWVEAVQVTVRRHGSPVHPALPPTQTLDLRTMHTCRL